MKRKLPVLLAVFFKICILCAQDNYPKETPKSSDNAVALQNAGDVPVNLFTGQANISIPLTKIKNGPISVDVSLNYGSSGVKVNSKPTWVGLNWFLSAGGVINRKENIRFDEYTFKGYLDKYTALAASNWNTSAFLNTLKNSAVSNEVAPDEFSFNFNGMSGSFFLNHEGSWIVKSKSNYNFRISHVVTANYPIVANNSNNYTLARAITSFTIIADDGVKYVFGQSSNAIEFSYGQSTIIMSQSGVPQTQIQVSAWHLVQIIAPTGQEITFNYSKFWESNTITSSSISQPVLPGPVPTNINYPRRIAISSSILESITCNNGVSCYFNKSLTQMNLPQGPAIPNPEVPQGTALGTSQVNENYQFFNLDGIQLKYHNTIINNISFSYLKATGIRNKLQKVSFISPDGLETLGEYTFEYNSKILPAITSMLEDHWGYYNGKRYWDIIYCGFPTKPMPDESLYYQSREPDANFMDAEILQRIKFPAGGYTEFLFEPHEYSKLIKLSEASLTTTTPQLLIESQSSNKIGGGLRIKKISTYESPGSTPIVKEYFYNVNSISNGAISSGILNMKPDYMMTNMNYLFFNSQAFNIVNNQSPITYTEVMEKTGLGYTVNSFSNHDNGYLDKPATSPLALNSINLWQVYRLFSSLDLERGLLLNQKVFNSSKTIVKEISNEYNSDSNRYNICIRTAVDVLYEKFAAIPIYTFYPYLKKTIIKDFYSEGLTTNQIEYQYDLNYRLLISEKRTFADGKIKERRFQYPVNLYLGDNQEIDSELDDIKSMVANNVISKPIEIIDLVHKNGVPYVIGGKLFFYENFLTEKIFDLAMPIQIAFSSFPSVYGDMLGFHYSNNYKLANSYMYDNLGNITEERLRGGAVTSYVWGYNKQYQIAKIENASYQEVTNLLGASNLKYLNDGYRYMVVPPNPQLQLKSFTDIEMRTMLNVLQTNLPNSQTMFFTYAPLVGVTSFTDPKGDIKNYTYDSFNRLKTVRDKNQDVLSENEYHYKN
ncbi:YD repeat-containing protein [Flavobacterium anhuiense]|uniref:YD repeat-containing protein n=1 Tax=Flavobacterium anhuiense TaxID=459526 RepID=A0ABY0LIR5_9FLAO|nr:hypothetical protein [Flavobacterium anhuiense]SCY14766.1 YD repeat-containing protein [Flavobacterium anhuiense]